MSVVLHIGQPKAASSSLQRALWERRKDLAACGILYPDTPSRNHNGVVANFLLSAGVPMNLHFAQELQRISLAGSWTELIRQAREAGQLILSSEWLTIFPPKWIERFVGELGVMNPDILLCVRQASDSLPSNYSQLAKTARTLGFESWLRASLRFEGGLGVFPHDIATVQQNWSPFGKVQTVLFQPQAIESFESDVLSILGIHVSRPFLGRFNTSPSAAMVEAWQKLIRAGRVLDASLLRKVPDVGAGRYALRPDVARVVDRAYPMRGVGCQAARAELRVMTLRPEPLTTTGLSDRDWAESVAVCSAALQAVLP